MTYSPSFPRSLKIIDSEIQWEWCTPYSITHLINCSLKALRSLGILLQLIVSARSMPFYILMDGLGEVM